MASPDGIKAGVVITSLFVAAGIFMWAISPVKPFVKANNATAQKAGLSISQENRIMEYAKTWPTTPAYGSGFNALDPTYKVVNADNSLFDPDDDYWGLPRDEKGSYELVDGYCTACHSLSIVMQQHATEQRWRELLVWMENSQGMVKLSAEFNRGADNNENAENCAKNDFLNAAFAEHISPAFCPIISPC